MLTRQQIPLTRSRTYSRTYPPRRRRNQRKKRYKSSPRTPNAEILTLSRKRKWKKIQKAKRQNLKGKSSSRLETVYKGQAFGLKMLTTPIPYPQLFGRFFTFLHERRPELIGETGQSMKNQPPQCL